MYMYRPTGPITHRKIDIFRQYKSACRSYIILSIYIYILCIFSSEFLVLFSAIRCIVLRYFSSHFFFFCIRRFLLLSSSNVLYAKPFFPRLLFYCLFVLYTVLSKNLNKNSSSRLFRVCVSVRRHAAASSIALLLPLVQYFYCGYIRDVGCRFFSVSRRNKRGKKENEIIIINKVHTNKKNKMRNKNGETTKK